MTDITELRHAISHLEAENARLRDEIAYLKGHGHVGGGMICDFSPDFQAALAAAARKGGDVKQAPAESPQSGPKGNAQ